MEELIQFELSHDYKEHFRQALESRDDHLIAQSLEGVQPADISALLDEFDTDESKYVLDLLPAEVRAEIINDLDHDVREKFLRIYQSDEITEIINELDSDDAVDILNELP